jgi:hypothetical protein
MEIVGHHVRIPLGWMDDHTLYQLTTILSIISYGLFSCFEDKTCLREMECNIPREVIWVVIWEVPNENGG